MNICFYFQVHQPFRLKKYSLFDIGASQDYFDDVKNFEVMKKVARKCYNPMNELLLDLIKRFDGKFKVSFSISGVALEQFEQYCPEVLQSFKDLVATGCVELLAETYHHSLAFFYDHEEFVEQIRLHTEKIQQLFGVTPTVFRNTELTYRNDLAPFIERLGFKAILLEGWDPVMGWRNSNHVYKAKDSNIKLLPKNYKLSDDIAFRFSNKGWDEWPLTIEKFESWIGTSNGETMNLFMDYETFGEHQWEDTGIFSFMEQLPATLLHYHSFATPCEIAELPAKDIIDVPNILSWADTERDLTAWVGNRMQQDAMKKIFSLKDTILSTKNNALIDDWRKLTTSDHFYYMCTKWSQDGDVHKYFSPYDSPYEGFIAFMNVINDLQLRMKKELSQEWKTIGGI